MPEIRVTVNLSNTSALDLVRPYYPGDLHVAGTWVVRVKLDRSGQVVSARALSGHPLLKTFVVDAARKTRFKRNSTRGGKYVTGTITYTVTFAEVSYDELHSFVGQQVALRGKFSLRGKIGPFVLISGRPVYLVARGPFDWGQQYSDMEGKPVIVTGTLRFFRAEPAPESSDSAVARVPDHFYFEAESMRVMLDRQ